MMKSRGLVSFIASDPFPSKARIYAVGRPQSRGRFMPTLLNTPITTALTASVGSILHCTDGSVNRASIQGVFVYGSGGTTADVWVQTSLDGGATWIDIANFHFTTANASFVYNLNAATSITTEYTPTDGTLAANTSKDGILSPLFRTKTTTTGTYAGTTNLKVDLYAAGPLVMTAF